MCFQKHLTTKVTNMRLLKFYSLNFRTMNYLKPITIVKALSFVLLLATLLVACMKEEDEFPITNDLRVLQKKVGNTVVADGVADLSVLSQIQLVFSHALNREAFEAALSVSPEVSYSVVYDESGSFVTIVPTTRFAYETNYKIELPVGAYGTKGEKSVEAFIFNFTTKAFEPPKITLTSSALTFFEGESVTVTASLDNIIFDAVTFDLNFGGTAVGGGIDYTVSATSISIPAGSTMATFTVTSLVDAELEATETIIITLSNVVNGSNNPPQSLTLSLADKAPSIELKGVMHMNAGTGNTIRAFHLNVLKDIDDLSTYGIGINSNGSQTPINPESLNYKFPAMSVKAGNQILVVRSGTDATNAIAYFGACYSQFDYVLEGLASGSGISHNGNDAILLYNDGVAIETFGEFGVDGIGQPWEYTGSWGYKLGGEWIYGAINCANNVGSGTTQTSACVYPLCSEGLEFVGIMSLQPSEGRIRAYHLRALKNIPDLGIYTLALASNGAATFATQFSMGSISVNEGDDIFVVRDLDVARASNYFGNCYSSFERVIPLPNITSNGDDVIGLFKNSVLIETYGVLGVDGTGMVWDYEDSWAYKVGGAWTYGGVGCTVGAASNATSSCPYTFCN